VRYDIPKRWHTSLGLSIVVKLTYKVYKLHGLSKTVGDGDDLEIAACEFGMKIKGIEKLAYKVKVSGVSEFAMKSNEAKIVLIF
jgi:predicted peroxiredoxin